MFQFMTIDCCLTPSVQYLSFSMTRTKYNIAEKVIFGWAFGSDSTY